MKTRQTLAIFLLFGVLILHGEVGEDLLLNRAGGEELNSLLAWILTLIRSLSGKKTLGWGSSCNFFCRFKNLCILNDYLSLCFLSYDGKWPEQGLKSWQDGGHLGYPILF